MSDPSSRTVVAAVRQKRSAYDILSDTATGDKLPAATRPPQHPLAQPAHDSSLTGNYGPPYARNVETDELVWSTGVYSCTSQPGRHVLVNVAFLVSKDLSRLSVSPSLSLDEEYMRQDALVTLMSLIQLS